MHSVIHVAFLEVGGNFFHSKIDIILPRLETSRRRAGIVVIIIIIITIIIIIVIIMIIIIIVRVKIIV